MTDTDALRRAIDAQARHLIACNLVEETLTARDHAILVALSLGASGADVARATGLTEGRISQLKRAANVPPMPEESVAQLRAAGWSEAKITAALQRRADRRAEVRRDGR